MKKNNEKKQVIDFICIFAMLSRYSCNLHLATLRQAI